MSEVNQLLDFIESVKSQGASDEFVVALLRQNGWSEKRIYQAFTSWYEARIGKTVPNGGGRVEAAKDAFLYLFAFITLAIWTIQLGALFFSAIDLRFPNQARDFANNTYVMRRMANELASIIVAFPLFLWVTRIIVRSIQHQPERSESAVRKWLTYLALVITATTMITDVVTFLAYFLQGDLSTRFVLQVLTVLIIAGGVFAYYLGSLRREVVSSSRDRLFAFSALAIVGFGIIVGFSQLGSPRMQMSAAADARRLFDLSSLSEGIHERWLNRAGSPFLLPATIQEIQRTAAQSPARVVDPITGRPYEYIPFKERSYVLCATFARPSLPEDPVQWRHAAGHVCFTRDASDNVQISQAPW